MGETGCYRCTGQERFEGAICDGCGSVADGYGGFDEPGTRLSVGEPRWIVWTGEAYDPRNDLGDALNRFDAAVDEMDSGSGSPALWVAYPLALHALHPDVDEDAVAVSESVVEYADPVSALTAERDQARAQRDAAIARRDAALDRVFDLLRGMLSADDLSRVQEAARLGDVDRGEP
jgi:hypothetical protein